MPELWPDTLPQKLNVQGHSYNFGDSTIRSAPSVGPSKVRPRSSAVSQPLAGQMFVTTDQLATLRTFYKVTVRGADVFLFPDPERPSTYAITVAQVIQSLGLSSGLSLLLEAGSISSWPGGATQWYDVSGNSFDFYLGLDATSGSNDPIFSGTPGGVNLYQHWVLDGNDFFTFETAANTAWMQRLHQDGAKFSLVAMVYMPGSGVERILGTDAGGTSVAKVGVSWGRNSAGAQIIDVANGGAAFAMGVNGAAIQTTGWGFQAVTVDESAGTGYFFADYGSAPGGGVITPFNSIYTTPSAGSASHTMQIGAGGNSAVPLANGSQLAFVAAWEGVTLSQADMQKLSDTIWANYNAPVFPSLNCRFVGPPTITAVSKPDLWSVTLPMEIVP